MKAGTFMVLFCLSILKENWRTSVVFNDNVSSV
ncbi:hypothetical protein GLYMA_07G047450v4 [Glycine max]|nr:hypothetical protein GLYMA_07G047450v4 [Glycine max]KAH1085417.1 hypothetical protein GYH30_017421 [Glycine max]